jgi:hypothetical protein
MTAFGEVGTREDIGMSGENFFDVLYGIVVILMGINGGGKL